MVSRFSRRRLTTRAALDALPSPLLSTAADKVRLSLAADALLLSGNQQLAT
jgi:hypothetical protein